MKGSTFLRETGTREWHLYVILTNPCEEDQVLTVAICSIKGEGIFHDGTCEVPAGSHEFIVKDSYVSYGHLERFSVARIEKMLRIRGFIKKSDIDEGLLERIRDGIELSDFSPLHAIEYFLLNSDR